MCHSIAVNIVVIVGQGTALGGEGVTMRDAGIEVNEESRALPLFNAVMIA